MCKNIAGLIFDDKDGLASSYSETIDHREEDHYDNKMDNNIVIAEVIKDSKKNNHFNPMNESSINSSKDQICDKS